MKQITLPKIDLKTWVIIALVIVLLFTLNNCNNTDVKLALSESKRTEIVKNANERLSSLAEQNKDADFIKEVAINKVILLQKENVKLSIDKVTLKASLNNQLKAIKTFSNSEIATFYKERYNLPKQVKSSLNGVILSDTIAKLNIADVIGGDNAVKELDLTYRELLNTHSIITQKDNIISQHNNKEINFNGMLVQKDLIIEADNQLIKAQEKSIRSEKRKKTGYKLVTAASIILNIFLVVRK